MLCCNRFVSVFKSLRKDLGFLGGISKDFSRLFFRFSRISVFIQTFLGCNSKHSNIRMFESLLFELSSRVESNRIESNIRLFRIFAHPYLNYFLITSILRGHEIFSGCPTLSFMKTDPDGSEMSFEKHRSTG